MIFYVIRHKATGELMPQGKRDRGYSHWNPNNTEHKFDLALRVPRLLDTRRRAAHCITAWASMPNARQTYTQDYYGNDDTFVDIKADGREKEDLEVVEVDILLKDENGKL